MRNVRPGQVEDLLARHSKVALQFSGGKDSMACLYLLRPYLEHMTVYWVNTGDPLPETVDVMEVCKEFIPHFVEVRTDSRGWTAEHGIPSDLVPTFSSPLGRLLGFGQLKVSDRFACCFNNVMAPMYHRMKADGVTCVIRGQKLVDMPTVPLRSGDSADGFEFFYPIEDWSHQDVLNFLAQQDAPTHPCYEYGTTGVDCAHCTAWWDESHFTFIRDRHPAIHKKVSEGVAGIRAAVNVHLQHLQQFKE